MLRNRGIQSWAAGRRGAWLLRGTGGKYEKMVWSCPLWKEVRLAKEMGDQSAALLHFQSQLCNSREQERLPRCMQADVERQIVKLKESPRAHIPPKALDGLCQLLPCTEMRKFMEICASWRAASPQHRWVCRGTLTLPLGREQCPLGDCSL